MIKPKTFKQKLIQYCTYRDWKFNPEHLKTTATDKEYNRIHKKENGKDMYYFFIDTSGESDPIVVPNLGGAEECEDMPLF